MTYVRVLAGLAISAACIVLILTQIDFQLTWAALTRAHAGLLLLGLLVVLAAIAAKAYRWGLLYYPTTGLRLGSLSSALYIGYLVSAFVPMRLGEVARAYLIGKTEPVTFSQSVGTILVEKVLDVLTILVFLAGLALLGHLPPLAVPGWTLAALGLGGLAGLLALAILPQALFLSLVERLARFLPAGRGANLAQLVLPFLDALAILRYRQLLPALAFWSLVSWTLVTLLNYVVMEALGVAAPVSAAVFVMVVTNLGMIVPSAPGYVGVYEGLVWAALAPYGVDPSQALGFALALHALTYAVFIVIGLACIWRGGYRLADLRPVGTGWRNVSRPSAGGSADPAARTEIASAPRPGGPLAP
jgi:glycosyltransferase 2 family protein